MYLGSCVSVCLSVCVYMCDNIILGTKYLQKYMIFFHQTRAQSLLMNDLKMIRFGNDAVQSGCRERLIGPKTVVTCKIKHLQKCFRAVDFSWLCRGRKML